MRTSGFIIIVIMTFFSISPIAGQDLTKEETLEYLRSKCTQENNYRKSLPNNQMGTQVSDYEIKLDYEYLVVNTILKNGDKNSKKYRLKDSEVHYKYIEPKTWKYPGEVIVSYGGYQINIGYDGPPSFLFTNKEDADNIINALNYLKKFCKEDPFSVKKNE